MKVILTQDVPNLGDEGDVVKAAPGYFRNYLSPRGMAVLGTASALKDLEFKKKRIEKIRAERRADAVKQASKLEGLEVLVRHRCGEKGQLFGSVTTSHIADAMLSAGYELDRRKIVLTHPIKSIGEHVALVRVYTGVEASLKVIVKPEEDQEAAIMEAIEKAQRQQAEAEERIKAAAAAAKAAAAAEAAGEDPEAAAAEAAANVASAAAEADAPAEEKKEKKKKGGKKEE